MPDALDALSAEATRDGTPVLVRTLHGRTWRFGQIDIRPSALRRYAALAETLSGKHPHEINPTDAIELSATAEDMLRSALPLVDRSAFDTAPFGGADIQTLITDYFTALGVEPGESVASPGSSVGTRKRSRPTSPRRGRR